MERAILLDDNGIIEESDFDEIQDKYNDALHGRADFNWSGDLIFAQIIDRTR